MAIDSLFSTSSTNNNCISFECIPYFKSQAFRCADKIKEFAFSNGGVLIATSLISFALTPTPFLIGFGVGTSYGLVCAAIQKKFPKKLNSETIYISAMGTALNACLRVLSLTIPYSNGKIISVSSTVFGFYQGFIAGALTVCYIGKKISKMS
ncbi:MAG: hypothetical protein WC222_05310 [Parachlamydiales bacterium]|jgi:hypothetical protein